MDDVAARIYNLPMSNTNTFRRFVSNARTLGHGAHVVAAAATLCGVPVRSLCAWCAEHVEGEAERLGGECEACSYVGRDCLAVAS